MSLALSAQRLMAMGCSWQLANMLTGNGGAPNGISIQFGAGEHIYESVTDAITAKASGNQTTGTALVSDINRVTTVASTGDAVVLEPSVPGLTICVLNAAANAMNVYPAVGDAINSLGVNAAYSQGATSACVFYCTVTGTWHTNYSPFTSTGTGAEVMQTSPTITTPTISAPTITSPTITGPISGPLQGAAVIVATAGASQGTATAIPASAVFVNVTTTTSAEGVKLPTASTGRMLYINGGTGHLFKVYGGAAGQSINAGTTATTAFVMASLKPCVFIGASGTKWLAIKSA